MVGGDISGGAVVGGDMAGGATGAGTSGGDIAGGTGSRGGISRAPRPALTSGVFRGERLLDRLRERELFRERDLLRRLSVIARGRLGDPVRTRLILDMRTAEGLFVPRTGPSLTTLSCRSRGSERRAASALASIEFSAANRATSSPLVGTIASRRPAMSRIRAKSSAEGSALISGPKAMTARCCSIDRPRSASVATGSTKRCARKAFIWWPCSHASNL